MSEWVEIMKNVGINIGVLLIVLGWLTQKLIPQLQKERSEAIAAFHQELESERTVHLSVNQNMMESAKEERILHREDRDKFMSMYERSLAGFQDMVRTTLMTKE